MTDITTQDQPAQPKACINCGNPEIVRDTPNALCAACREKFIKFPIPLWVKLFGAGITALVIYSCISLPAHLSTGITFEKGLRAESGKNYLTAQHYFRDVVNKVPDDIEARAHLLIAAYYNNDLYTFSAMADSVTGHSVDDDELLHSVQVLLDNAAEYFPSESFIELKNQYPDAVIPDTAYIRLINSNSTELFTRLMYAASLHDANNYAASDKVLSGILAIDKNHIGALGMIAGVKRLENELDASLAYCDQLLAINHESTYAICSKARTLLKMKRNDEALKLAQKSYALDSSDNYCRATLALAYHFNNDIKSRDKIMNAAAASKDSAAAAYFKYVSDIIANRDSL